ncbi:MAG: DsbA family oxidoreductase [Gammaproteobacteria bacterium]|nr:DsbA family oxidoreductase [Gammaproteobacteria bacterium]
MSKSLSIEVVSDPVCPFCYIGKRRLQAAIEQCPHIEIKVTWRPFQLNPDMPREGMDRDAYYRQKFGDMGVDELFSSVRGSSQELGIVFEHKPGSKSPNTLRAHVLLDLAGQISPETQDEIAEALFHAHHVACDDIGDIDVLVRLAGQAGMDESTVREALSSESFEPAVKEAIQMSVARGVTGVPFFVINDSYGVSGAQPPESLLAVFEQVANAAPLD